MKKVLFLTCIFVLSSTVSVTAATCPSPRRTARVPNHIFFSFYEKTATLGKHLPRGLTRIDPQYVYKGRARCLTQQTYTAFLKLRNAVEEATQQSLIVVSAWRSPETQQKIGEKRGEFAALPGRSEHQLGTAVDLTVVGMKETERFGEMAAYTWMKDNAHEYGFVQSFTSENQVLTGIPSEPWHWRYVGKTLATAVYKQKRYLNEYLYERKQLQQKTRQ